MMDEPRIRALAAELDAAVPREGAVVRITDSLPDDDGALTVAGNTAGVIRLAADLISAALAAAAPPERPQVLELEQWVDGDSDWSTAVVRVGALAPRPPAQGPSLGDRVMLGGRLPLLIAALLAAFVLGIAVASR